MELMQASHQWATRPSDERFTSLHDLRDHVAHERSISRDAVVSSRSLEFVPDSDNKGLFVQRREVGKVAVPTHYATGQLATLAKAPVGYLRTLPSPLVADLLNYGLNFGRDVEETKLLFRINGKTELAAATGLNYGRVWNSDIADALVRNFGDGLTGDWRVPGEFGKRVQVSKSNTTLYASDRDMFVFLADEKNRVRMDNRRNGKSGSLARGFFVWNSEVGAATLGVAMFLFDYACSNRIVWGAKDFREIKLRHTSGAPDRFLEQVMPVIDNMHKSSAAPIEAQIEAAQAKRLDTSLADFLKNRRYSTNTIAAIECAHLSEEFRPIETVWDVVTGITAHAKSITYQDDRIAMERDAGRVLDMVV